MANAVGSMPLDLCRERPSKLRGGASVGPSVCGKARGWRLR